MPVTGGLERPAAPQAAGSDRTGVLIRLEGAIDDLLHEIKLTGIGEGSTLRRRSPQLHLR